MNKSLSIALLVKTDADWHRSLILGVAQYAEDVGGWNFTVPPADGNGDVALPTDWQGDGIIGRITSERVETAILSTNLPCVNVSWLTFASPEIPSVYSDERGCARLAAQFLLEKQYDHYGYIGFPPWLPYSHALEESLREQYQCRGFQLDSFELSHDAQQNCGIDSQRLKEWLEQIGKPAAIVVWSSAMGQIVTQQCLKWGIDVPHAIAILCVEHDPLWSSLAPIPLSNIDQDPWRVGFSAAKLLHSMIKGNPAPVEPILIDPISIVQRRSTEASAAKDPVLDLALKFIYLNAKNGLTVKDVVDHIAISRRGLEAKFKHELNCSPAAFIRRIQLQSVARLLRTTELNISAIAGRTGFAYPEVLMRSFKREFGLTPMQFRGAGSLTSKPVRG